MDTMMTCGRCGVAINVCDSHAVHRPWCDVFEAEVAGRAPTDDELAACVCNADPVCVTCCPACNARLHRSRT